MAAREYPRYGRERAEIEQLEEMAAPLRGREEGAGRRGQRLFSREAVSRRRCFGGCGRRAARRCAAPASSRATSTPWRCLEASRGCLPSGRPSLPPSRCRRAARSTRRRHEIWGEMGRCSASRHEIWGEMGRCSASRHERWGEMGRCSASRRSLAARRSRPRFRAAPSAPRSVRACESDSSSSSVVRMRRRAIGVCRLRVPLGWLHLRVGLHPPASRCWCWRRCCCLGSRRPCRRAGARSAAVALFGRRDGPADLRGARGVRRRRQPRAAARRAQWWRRIAAAQAARAARGRRGGGAGGAAGGRGGAARVLGACALGCGRRRRRRGVWHRCAVWGL